MAEVQDDVDTLEETVFFGDPAWEALATAPVDAGALEERHAGLDPDDPINIQYTSGTTGARRAPPSATTTSSTTASSSGSS